MSATGAESNRLRKKHTFKRGYKACLNCKMRKVKCDLGPFDNPHDPPCVRCKREGKDCMFAETKRGGFRIAKQSLVSLKEENAGKSMAEVITSVIQGQTQVTKKESSSSFKEEKLESNEEDDDDDMTLTAGVPSLHNAFQFLAKAAGSVAKEEIRDSVHHITNFDRMESINDISRPESASAYSNDNSFISTEQHGIQSLNSMETPTNGEQTPRSIPLIEKLSSVRPKPSMKLVDIEYIGPYQLLTEAEARKRIDAFFLTMHPFSPYIPLQLHDPDELARYPLLLCTILTISARYHTLRDLGLNEIDNNVHVELHEKLWIYCQRLVSQTVWAEASTRCIGTILAFLMFTEWNPRAIHWKWPDYANYPEMNDSSKRSSSQSHGSDSLAGLAAMRRSDRMSWMLTGNAVRLAQDLDVLEYSSKIFVMTHVCETHTAMNLNKRSSLSESLSEVKLNGFEDNNLDNEQFFLERILQNDKSKERWARFLDRIGERDKKHTLTNIEREFLNDEFLLYYYNTDNHNSQVEQEFRLKFSKIQRAKIELLKIISLGYENVYNGKLRSHDRHQRLSMLSVLSPLIEGWYNIYKTLLLPVSGPACSLTKSSNKSFVFEITEKMEHESLISDYYYCQLYIYSLALQLNNKEPGKSKLRLNELTKSARYVELAYNAAKEILNSAQRVHKLKILKYMPVRWVMRIVRSIVFMIKCYLTLTGNGITQNPEANTILTMSVLPTDEIIQTIQKTAIILRATAPDELHLCSRYSTILMYLCTEMKHRSKPNMQPPIPRSISSDFIDKDKEKEKEEEKSDKKNTTRAANSGVYDGNTVPLKHTHYSNDNKDNTRQSGMGNNVAARNTGYHSGTQLHANHTGSGTATDGNGSTLGGYLPPQIVDWFNDNNEIGLDFVGPWTEMVEKQFVNRVDDDPSYENWFKELYNPSS